MATALIEIMHYSIIRDLPLFILFPDIFLFLRNEPAFSFLLSPATDGINLTFRRSITANTIFRAVIDCENQHSL